MPTYQYTCTECGTPIEAVQSFSDAALTVCPSCGGRLRKVFSAVGVVFKGSGFYRTDSRDSGKKPSTVSADAGSSNTDAGSKSTDAATKGSDKTPSTDKTSGNSTSTPKVPAGSGSGSAGSADRAAGTKKPSSGSSTGSSAA